MTDQEIEVDTSVDEVVVTPPDRQCPECDRTFRVQFTGPTGLHHAKTRYCPRCGARL